MYYKLQGFRPRKIQLLETALKREKICVPEKYAKRIEEFGIAKSLGTGRTKKEKKRDTGELQANLQSEVISGLSIQSRVKSDVQIEIASSSSDTQLLNKKVIFPFKHCSPALETSLRQFHRASVEPDPTRVVIIAHLAG